MSIVGPFIIEIVKSLDTLSLTRQEGCCIFSLLVQTGPVGWIQRS
jgi:hypothetical protein